MSQVTTNLKVLNMGNKFSNPKVQVFVSIKNYNSIFHNTLIFWWSKVYGIYLVTTKQTTKDNKTRNIDQYLVARP